MVFSFPGGDARQRERGENFLDRPRGGVLGGAVIAEEWVMGIGGCVLLCVDGHQLLLE